MKALIIHSHVHSLFADADFTPEQEAALPTWNNGNPAPDALVVVPPEWEPYIDSLFRWTEADGLAEPEPGYVLGKAKVAKLAEFDAALARLDALKIRPAAGIAEAISKGQTPDPGDVYVLSETQAVTEENRRRRDLVQAAESVEAMRAVEVFAVE